MRRRTFLAASGAVAASAALSTTSVLAAEADSLLKPWTGAHGGLPPFDKVKLADFLPALRTAMAEELKEVDAIADSPAQPTFDNTLAALERTGKPLERAGAIYGVWSANLSTPEFQAVEQQIEPLFAAHADRILQNERLFKRIEAVYAARETSGLTPEQKRLSWVVYNRFVRAGAKLSPEQKTRVAAIKRSR